MCTQTMPAVVQFGLQPLQVELREIAVPDFGENDVLLRVGAVGVCGSDVHQYHAAHSWLVNISVTLGHEFGGTCGDCRTGNCNLCPTRSGFGNNVNGAITQPEEYRWRSDSGVCHFCETRCYRR